MPLDQTTSFHERFLAIRDWIERRTDEPGTVQTRQLVSRARQERARRAAPRGRAVGGRARRGLGVRSPGQLALDLGGTAG